MIFEAKAVIKAKPPATPATVKLVPEGSMWLVPSQGGNGKYVVDAEANQCTCPDFETRQTTCKHLYAVSFTIERETTADGQTVVTETMRVTRKTYTQDWKAYNRSQTHEKSELQALLYELCKNLPEPEKPKGKGRPSLVGNAHVSGRRVRGEVTLW